MYQSQFGLDRRPFSSTPDPCCVVPVGGMPEAISELEHCAQDGQGIGVLTAPAGLGKTILCRKLADGLRDQFAVVFLPNANFPTRRSLLQAILYEMGHPYLRLGEQELRLEFTTAIRDLHPDRQGLVLIVDEAHLLHNRLLEELRTATHLVHDGELLVRLILSGQLELEERLAKKDLAAINQRIVCHSTLSPLTRLESQEYLQQRIEWAGGVMENLFEPEALRLIVQASDGCPRCLNQLADHSLLFASAESNSRVTATHVFHALEELKQLPLHWNHVEAPRPAESEQTSVVEIVCGGSDETEEVSSTGIGFGVEDEDDVESEEFVFTQESLEEDDFFMDSSESEAGEMGPEENEDCESIEWVWDAEEQAISQDLLEISSAEPTVMESAESIPDVEQAATGLDVWSLEPHHFAEIEIVQDHYAGLAAGRPAESLMPPSPDWSTWDPVAELRSEEEAFAVPLPASISPDPTIIHAIPDAGEEWQPEDLILPSCEPEAEPIETIEQILPVLEAELGEASAAVDPIVLELASEDSAPLVLSDPSFEALLMEFAPQHCSEDLPLVFAGSTHCAPAGDVGRHSEYLPTGRSPASPGSSADLEMQIAQTVLDTYMDVQSLLGNGAQTGGSGNPAEPPPSAAGEEPIRDPGDAAPFDELRKNLEDALAASQRVQEAEFPPPAASESRNTAAAPPPDFEYDIVLPEPDDEPAGISSKARADAPEAKQLASQSAPRAYKNLFSQIRRKEQA